MGQETILLIEDDADIRAGIHILLEGEGYSIVEAGDAETGLAQLDDEMDLVILDVMLPGMSGFDACAEIRSRSMVPVLFLTAKTLDADREQGLVNGGDDYLSKPFSYAELLTRVRALIRRYRIYQGRSREETPEPDAQPEPLLEIAEYRINLEHNEVWKREQAVELTEMEYKIFRLLAQNPKKIYSVQQLYEAVWEQPFLYDSNGTVMVHIRRLRVKLEDNPKEPEHIRTIWGKGYRFE